LIDKVTIESKMDGVQAAQVWGVFALFDEVTKSFYEPQSGYLYFEFPTSAGDVRKQLLAAAGSEKVVGLQGRLGDPPFSHVHMSIEGLPPRGVFLAGVFPNLSRHGFRSSQSAAYIPVSSSRADLPQCFLGSHGSSILDATSKWCIMVS
jgi:hypothetical protein